MRITEAIRKRSSIRTYKGIPLTEKEKSEFLDYMNSEKGFFNAPVRFGIVEASGNKEMKLGTYGVIKDARTYVVSAVEPGDYNMEELGFRMEKGILYATKKGFGTCWLAGTFNRADFGKAIGLKDSEYIPAITPIGLHTEKRRFVDSAMRTLVGATSRKPWKELFFDGSFAKPLQEGSDGVYGEALEMVRLGPSASNKQPWRIVKDETGYHFYLAHTKNYPATAQRMDMGIAMCHFELTLLEAGEKGKFAIKKPSITCDENTEYIISWIKE